MATAQLSRRAQALAVVYGPRVLDRWYLADVGQVPPAREFVRWALRRWGCDGDQCATAELLTGELAANAVTHGSHTPSAGFVVTAGLAAAERLAWVSVADEGPRGTDRPRVRPIGPDADGGRGLWLVSELSSAWGTRPAALGGWLVWFRLPVTTAGNDHEGRWP